MKTLSFLFLTFFCTQVYGQQFGGFPPSTKWKQIRTDTVRIIFTPGAEPQAERIATLIQRAAADTPFALGKKLRRINIVLQSNTTTANGFVGLAPFKSEFYLVPGANVFDFGSLPWEESLAIHEYRHVQQYNNFNRGISKGFYFLFGEQGLALANALAVPDWFFEGDAVHTETALTPQGRGRQPYFLSGYNSLFLENRKYSWQKLRNGSLKDYVPNHYQLGYLLVNYGYEKYGPDFWKKVTQDASEFRGVFYPLQHAIKKYSGVSYKTFRDDAFVYYRKPFQYNSRAKPTGKRVVDYYFPRVTAPGSILYLKSSYNKLPAFYTLIGNKEKKVRLKSIGQENWLSYRNGEMVYTAYSTNPRWTLTDYTDIVVLDVRTGKENRITSHKKYYTPDISPSGEWISAIRIDDSLHTILEVLDRNGIVMKSFKGGANYFINPRFLNNDNIIVGARTNDAKMSLQQLNISSGKLERLTPDSYSSISVSSVNGDTVYLTAGIYGNDDLFALTLHDKKLFQLTRRLTGTYSPSASEDSLYFTFFTSNGERLQSMPKKDLLWADVNLDSLNEYGRNFRVALPDNILNLSTRKFGVEPYSKSTHLFNFHSWAPNYNDPEFTFSLYGDNILNTFSNQLYYRYNGNENSHGIGWSGSYGGLYPQLNAGAEYTFDRHAFLYGTNRVFDQFEASVGYNIPLNFTKNRTFKLLNFGSNFVFNRSMPNGLFKGDSLNGSSSTYLHHFVTWAHYLPRAIQHIYPKLGYTVSAAYRHYLNSEGSQFITSGQLFLPSFGNHSIVLSGSWQETVADTNDVIFANRFANSRGYADNYFVRMWRLSANYHFPIVYPDFGVASIVYFQRLRGNVFYDYTKVYNFIKQPLRNLRSVGGELFFDTRWWNQQPISFGIRVSHLLDDGFSSTDKKGNNLFEFILPLNLIPN